MWIFLDLMDMDLIYKKSIPSPSLFVEESVTKLWDYTNNMNRSKKVCGSNLSLFIIIIIMGINDANEKLL